jgi:hypothetical protein
VAVADRHAEDPSEAVEIQSTGVVAEVLHVPLDDQDRFTVVIGQAGRQVFPAHLQHVVACGPVVRSRGMR